MRRGFAVNLDFTRVVANASDCDVVDSIKNLDVKVRDDVDDFSVKAGVDPPRILVLHCSGELIGIRELNQGVIPRELGTRSISFIPQELKPGGLGCMAKLAKKKAHHA